MKTKRFLTVFVMAAFLVASCAKETTPATQENINSDTPAQEQGGVVVNPDGTLTLTFTTDATSKTSLASDGKTVNWVAGDEIRFWGGETTYDATAQSSEHYTTFSSITVPEELSELYVTYPAGIATQCEEGTLSIKFPSNHTDGGFASTDFSVAKAVKTSGAWNTSLHFKNIASLLQVSLSDNEVTQLSVEGLDGETMAGTLPVSFDASGDLVFGEVSSASTKVNLSVDGAGEYFIPVIPGTVSNGFRVTMLKGSDPQLPFTFVGSYTLAAGQITKLKDVDQHNGQFYVTPSGSGLKGGTGWNNAMSAAQFKDFIENGGNQFLIKGATFHFSAEEFTFGDYVQPDFSGHSEVDFTLEGTRSGSAMTTFIGGSGDPAGMLWPKASANVTVKNVKFTGTNGNSNRAAIRVNTSSAKLQLENCVFENNQTSGQSGAINLIQGTATITNCEFTGNSSSTGGASIHVENATATIKGCTFTGNSGDGNALHLTKPAAVVTMEDCEISGGDKCTVYGVNANTVSFTRVNFHDNHAADESGAAGWLEGAGTYTFTDCEFVDNSADWRGGAIVIASGNVHASFTGGKFQGNHADGVSHTDSAGGAIYAYGTDVCVDCSNVLFKSNYSNVGSDEYAGGIIRVEQDGGIARFDGCVFDGNYSYRNKSANAACAAIVSSRTKAPIYYFNACEFKNNASGTYAGTGSKYGMVMATYTGCTIAMNNCSMHDNYGGRNTDAMEWIYIDSASSKLIISNSSIIGEATKKSGASGTPGRPTPSGTYIGAAIYLSNPGSSYLINNILCSPNTDSFSVRASGKTVTKAYFNKTSPVQGTCTWTDDTGSGHDYYGTSASFGNWDAPYIWNGTMTGTNSSMMAVTADVNTEIQNADADFYAWLESIGALGKDINGNSRGATSWPGCYQN